MRLIQISGDGDYGFMTFEGSEFNKPEELEKIWKEAMQNEEKCTFREIDEDDIEFDCYEFGEVDSDFIDFIREGQDYDSCKHSNFVILK